MLYVVLDLGGNSKLSRRAVQIPKWCLSSHKATMLPRLVVNVWCRDDPLQLCAIWLDSAAWLRIAIFDPTLRRLDSLLDNIQIVYFHQRVSPVIDVSFPTLAQFYDFLHSFLPGMKEMSSR